MSWTFYNPDGSPVVASTSVADASQATQSAIEAETNENTYIPPDLIKHSPGVAKGWCRIEADGTLTAGDYNVASITDSGTGQRAVVWDTDFADAEYSALATINNANIGLLFPIFDDNQAVGSVVHNIYNTSVALIDEESCVVAFGDQ